MEGLSFLYQPYCQNKTGSLLSSENAHHRHSFQTRPWLVKMDLLSVTRQQQGDSFADSNVCA